MPEIDYTYVEKLKKHFTNLWQPAYLNWEKWHDVHDQRHLIRFAQPAQARKLGIARSKISAMVDTLVTNDPTVTRERVDEGQAHEAKADKAEKWSKGLLVHAMTSGTVIPPFRSAGLYLALLGYSAGVVRWDDKVWNVKGKVARGPGYKKRLAEFERQKAKAFPFVIEFPHPARILLPYQERQPSVGIEIASMYGWQVKEMLDSQGLEYTDVHDDYASLEVLNYWDEQKRGLFVDKQDVEVRDNALGKVPFVHGFSGYGHERMPSESSMGPSTDDLAVGLLAGITGSIVALDEANTALTFLIQLASYPQYFTTENAEELTRKLNEAGLGGIVHVDTDPTHALQPSQIPQLGAWVFEQIASLRHDIDEGTYQGVVAGEISPRTPTATGTAVSLGQARLKFGEPMNQLNLMAGEILGLCARMTAERGETVTIDGVACGADDFEGNYDFMVDFMAKDEGQKLRDTAAANEGYKAGTESFEGVQEAKGVADVTGKWKEVLIGKARTSEQYQAAVLEQAIGIVKQRMADEAAKKARFAAVAIPPPPEPTMPQPGPLGPDGQPLPQQPQGFTTLPNGPQETGGIQRNMEQGLSRVIPTG